MGVAAVLTVAGHLPPMFPDQFEYKIVEIADHESYDLKQHFPDSIAYIEKVVKSGKKIYVHCFGGISRSATTLIAYFMYVRRINLREAFSIVSSKRPCIKPNEGFIEQLRLFEEDLKK